MSMFVSKHIWSVGQNKGFIIISFVHFCFQDSEENLKGGNEENGNSSDDFTLSPSDEEFEYILDCAPSAHGEPHEPEGHGRHILESKEESQEPHGSKTPTDARSESEVQAAEELPAKVPCPVPKPRHSRQTTPSAQPSTPTAKPRTVHLFNLSTPEEQVSPVPTKELSKAAPDSRPKQSLRKLQLSHEEKTQLVNLQSLSADSDSETPCGSSSCSSSSATAGGPSPPKPQGPDGQEEEGYWSGSTAGHIREERNRRCFRRKEMPGGQTRVRSKFSPWNLSSPRINRDSRLSVLSNPPGRVGTFTTHLGCGGKNPFLWVFFVSFIVPCLFCFFTTETTFSHDHSASEDGVDGDDDDDDEDDDMFENYDKYLSNEKVRTGAQLMFSCCMLHFHRRLTLCLRFQAVPSDPAEAEKLELMKMRTLERRAKTNELQRLRKAQVSVTHPCFIGRSLHSVRQQNLYMNAQFDVS